jgi:hypothetical protein
VKAKFYNHTKWQTKLQFCISWSWYFWIASWKTQDWHLPFAVQWHQFYNDINRSNDFVLQNTDLTLLATQRNIVEQLTFILLQTCKEQDYRCMFVPMTCKIYNYHFYIQIGK